MFIINGFGNCMDRYIENTIIVLILYKLTSYAHSQSMKGAILIIFTVMDTWCKMQAISIQMQARNA